MNENNAQCAKNVQMCLETVAIRLKWAENWKREVDNPISKRMLESSLEQARYWKERAKFWIDCIQVELDN